jgi:uncharacterized membrane protein YhaH (DUF805 family)
MGFGQSITTCFSKYATFAGRASRSEFWWWVLFVGILWFIGAVLDGLIGTTYRVPLGSADATVGIIHTILVLVVLLPGISVAVRRLHDTDKSGWWWWLNIICFIGGIVLLIFYVTDSGPDNRYGADPKGEHIPPPVLPPTTA